MGKGNENRFQWFVLTAVGGQEEVIAKALREKMNNYGYADEIAEIKVFMTKTCDEKIFSKNDQDLPANLRNTRSTTWEILPDGRYKRTKIKISNCFPGYIFIKMAMDSAIWYVVRNTNGVLGFIGSTGKCSLPVPISIEEYERIANECNEKTSKAISDFAKSNGDAKNKKNDALHDQEPKKVVQCPFNVGNLVTITSGSFANTEAVVKKIDLAKGTATVEYELFGRSNLLDISINDLKLNK